MKQYTSKNAKIDIKIIEKKFINNIIFLKIENFLSQKVSKFAIIYVMYFSVDYKVVEVK